MFIYCVVLKKIICSVATTSFYVFWVFDNAKIQLFLDIVMKKMPVWKMFRIFALY